MLPIMAGKNLGVGDRQTVKNLGINDGCGQSNNISNRLCNSVAFIAFNTVSGLWCTCQRISDDNTLADNTSMYNFRHCLSLWPRTALKETISQLVETVAQK